MKNLAPLSPSLPGPRISLGELMNVHYHSRPHKKDYGVLLSLQAFSCKAARLGVATAPIEGQKGIFPLLSATQPVTSKGLMGAWLQEH